MDLIEDVQPDVIVNFAGVTNVFNPWDNQLELVNQNLIIPVNILNTIKEINQNIFFFQASCVIQVENVAEQVART
jgi:GDP-D-mannose dehydratase